MPNKSAKKVSEKEGVSVYELGFLILPSIPEDKLSDVTASIREVIANGSGVEIDAEEPVKRDLAYRMSKTIGSSRYVIDDAYMGWIKFEASPDKVSEIKAGVDKILEVLRFILIKTERKTNFTFAKAMEKKTDDKPAESKEGESVIDPEKEIVADAEPIEEPVL